MKTFSQKEVAHRLGLSRAWIRVIEYRALVKMARALELAPPPLPRWMRQYEPSTKPKRPPRDHAASCARSRAKKRNERIGLGEDFQ